MPNEYTVRGAFAQQVDLASPAAEPPHAEGRLTVGETGAAESYMLNGQDPKTENGLWTFDPASPPSWSRAVPTAQMVYRDRVYVRAGAFQHCSFFYSGEDAPVEGEGSIEFIQESWGRLIRAGGGLRDNPPFIEIPKDLDIPGTYSLPNITVNEFRQITNIESSRTQTTAVAGLNPSRVSGTLLRVSPGLAWVPEPGRLVELLEAADVVGPWTPSSVLYLYLLWNGEEGAVEGTTDPPSAFYLDDARTKLGDATRRLIGAWPVDAQGQARPMWWLPADAFYATSGGALSVLLGGASQQEQQIDLAALGLVPQGCRHSWLRVFTNASSAVVLGNSEDAIDLPNADVGVRTVRQNSDKDVLMPLDANGRFTWSNRAGGGATVIQLSGYRVRR